VKGGRVAMPKVTGPTSVEPVDQKILGELFQS
jgi:hypothetical protein